MNSVSRLVFALVLSAGTIAALPCVCAEGPLDATSASVGESVSCGDRYNAMVSEAKSALTNGDRVGALRSLIDAKSQLRRCNDRDRENATGAVALALNWPATLHCCL